MLLLALLLAPLAHAATDDGPGALPWRVGAETGFAVDAASFPDSAGQSLEIYVRLRPSTLISLTKGGSEEGRFTLSVRLKSAFGKVEHQLEERFAVSEGDTVGGLGKVVMFPLRVRPGTYRLRVAMTTRRRAAVPGGVGRPQVESVEGEVVVPAPQGGGDLSDLEFVWSQDAAASAAAFRRGGRVVVPNPERLYGLFADSLRAMVVARARPGDERAWHWVARVLDDGGRVVSARESSAVGSRWLHAPIVLDASKFPAGGYELEVKAWQEGDEGALLRRARFSVAWEVFSWTGNPRDAVDNVHFLLGAQEEEAFARMQPGEQERVLADYWRARDPSPETAENERRDTFLRRVDFANRTFGRYGLGRGMFSDMGRVFIRYGEPSEVLKQVIPARDNTLEQVIRDLARQDSRELGNVADRMIGADMRPFEVWIYEGEIPVPIDSDPSVARSTRTRGRRLVFLFVDEHWVGDYRLRYSTE